MKVGIRRPLLKKRYVASPSAIYLDQLKMQRSTLEKFLEQQKECGPIDTSECVRITMKAYAMILEDAIKTASSLVQYLENKPIE